MNLSRARMPLAIGAVGAAGLLACAAYFLKLPPFEQEVGEISQSAVCESLGSPSQSAAALRSVLPEASSYTFDDEVNLRVGDRDDGYNSTCFVAGDGDELLTARTQMMRAGSSRSWVSGEIEQYAERSDPLTTFEAGAKGVASHSVAAVLVPCVAAGKIPGGQYNLSVVVQLKEAADTEPSETRAELIKLARNAAVYAHDEAKCGMPPTVS